MRFLLLGLGAIGTRHCRILRGLGHDVTTVDPDPTAGADYQAIPKQAWDSVLDCTPPDVRASRQLESDVYFVEKPLGVQLGIVEAYFAAPVQMGFCYRWVPSLQRFVNIINYHDIYSLSIVGGQHLQDWHKEDYRDVAYRYKGIITDSLPHSLYIARWILGELELLGSVSGKLSQLEISVEDTAALLLRSETGIPCYLLADYLRRPRGFYIEAVTSGGLYRWDFDPVTDVDLMYQRQMEVFCRLAAGEEVAGYPNLEDGIAVQRLLDEIAEEAR